MNRSVAAERLIRIVAWITLILALVSSFAYPSHAEGVTYTYDDLGRLKTVAYDDGTSITYGMDSAGNRTTVTTSIPDTVAPSVPTGLTGTAPSATKVTLTWNPSTDNAGGSGVAGYKLYRGGTLLTSVTAPPYDDTTVAGATAYSYTIAAFDGASNLSAQSSVFSITTPAAPDTTAPTAPSGLSSTAPSASEVDLSWTGSTDNVGGTGVAGYRIYRNGVLLTSTSGPATTFKDFAVSGWTDYTYQVSAYDGANNESTKSNTTSIKTPDNGVPSVPAGLSVTSVRANGVDLAWNASTDTGGSGVAGYRIYRNGTQIGTSGTTSYSDTTASSSGTYSYTVAAYDGATPSPNVSAQSAAVLVTTLDVTAPSVPTNLTTTSVSASAVNLAWTASTDNPNGTGVAGYRIYRNGTYIGAAGTNAYSDVSVTGSATYSYTVAAYDAATPAANVSAQSGALLVTTPDVTPPSVPTGLSATAASATTVNLSWTGSTDNAGGTGVAGYRIYRNGTNIASTASTSYSDTTVIGSSTYSYTVAAYDAATPTPNVSAQSSTASVTTPVGIPPVPTLSVSTPQTTINSQFQVSWTASTGATSYQLYETKDGGATSLIYTGSAQSQVRAKGRGEWTYTVKACSSAGCSAESNARTVSVCGVQGC